MKPPYEIVEVKNLGVASWSPGEDGENIPPTQVHLLYNVPALSKHPFMMRFKSREAVDSLINALIEHRDKVWGSRS